MCRSTVCGSGYAHGANAEEVLILADYRGLAPMYASSTRRCLLSLHDPLRDDLNVGLLPNLIYRYELILGSRAIKLFPKLDVAFSEARLHQEVDCLGSRKLLVSTGEEFHIVVLLQCTRLGQLRSSLDFSHAKGRRFAHLHRCLRASVLEVPIFAPLVVKLEALSCRQ